MNLSVAVSDSWGIGYKNELLFRIREDLQRFKQLTTGKTVVMGHNTFKSLPGGKILPNRENIVLSRNANLLIEGAIVCNSIEALQTLLQGRDPDNIFVIGGENIYTQLLNWCKLAYITKVGANPLADSFMPNIDKLSHWKVVEEIVPSKQGEIPYKFVTYHNENYFCKK